MVEADGRVVGVILESDFLIKERGRDHAHRSPLHWLRGDRRREFERVEATTAGEAMTAPAITIEGRMATVREAATVMAEHRINRLPSRERGSSSVSSRVVMSSVCTCVRTRRSRRQRAA